MNPISAFFVRNIILVFFFYGLAFFALGLALALASQRASEFRFVRAIVPLAVFGILHGLHEWFEMYQKIATLTSGYTPTILHESIRLVILVLSFLALLDFGLTLLSPVETKRRRILLTLLALGCLWAVATTAVIVLLRPSGEEAVAMGDVLARYALGIPGALLGAWAMMAQQRTFREHAMPQFGRDLVWAATALLLYGVIGQIFVRETALVPSNLVNSTLFLQWFGIPVQLFRGIMAAILALTMIRALNAFELENQRRLSAADQAKIQAQAESLEAERRTSQERERLNWELRQTTRELALLLDLSNLLATSMKLQDRLEAVMQRLVHSLSFPDAGMILLFEPPMDSLHLRAVSGFSQPEDDGWKAWSREVGERCALEGQVVCRHLDGETLALPFAEALTEPKCHLYASPITVLGLPLFVQEKVIGSLVLTQSEGAADGGVTVEELELILGIAQQLGLSIENARLSQEAQEREQMLGNLLHQVVDAQESERQRIARELHDATGQSLTAIALGLRGLEGMLEVGEDEPEAVVGQIRELKSFGTTALGELRQIIADLRPSILDDMGLAAALKWYVDSFQKRRSVPSTFVLEGDPVRLRSEFETVLFRIAQEALTNIAKYAAATQVTVTLCFAPPQVSLVVEDNGRGFEPRNVLQRQGNLTGWGLLGIQERASLLGGQYIIDSAPGQGTRVWVSVPMVQETLELDHDDHTSPAG